jgi:hypothetical protein
MFSNRVNRSYVCAVGLVVGVAAMVGAQTDPETKFCTFLLDDSQSKVHLVPPGGNSSPLEGVLELRFQDADDPACPGCWKVRATVAHLYAPGDPSGPATPYPLTMLLDPAHASEGIWLSYDGTFELDLYLRSADGNALPPQPIRLAGALVDHELHVEGDNGVNLPYMSMVVTAKNTGCYSEILFSTEVDFTCGSCPGFERRTHGDLLSDLTCLVLKNWELRQNFHPIVEPFNLGLDAVSTQYFRPIMFSLEDGFYDTWYGWISDGDLLADSGTVQRRNWDLIDAFIPVDDRDVGLDAVHADGRRYERYGFLFSVERDFRPTLLPWIIGHGDLLTETGRILRTNEELLRNFDPTSGGTDPYDFGLDAVFVRESGEIWFSVEEDFVDRVLGRIQDGDLLSDWGYVVRQNRDLMRACEPLEDLDDFGLDAVDVKPCACE